MAEFPELDQLRSVEELSARLTEVASTITRMHEDAGGRPFDSEQREEFAMLEAEATEAKARISELEARAKIVAKLSANDGNVEREKAYSFATRRSGVASGDDIYRTDTLNRSSETAYQNDLRDRALRSIDTSTFPDKDAKDKVANLVETIDTKGEIAQRILATGSPTYRRAFGKVLKDQTGLSMTPEERAALGIASQGGQYPIPYVVDPTVTLTSNGAINPVRQLARVVQITGNLWYGVSSSGISASYDAESAEVSDDTPTLTQPAAQVEMARAFVQYSMEMDDDWGGLQGEMARMFADAKDTLESSKFLNGLGHGSTQPEGLLVGANTGTLLTTNSSAIIVGDIYNMIEDLAPRWRSRAVFAGALGAYQKIRQLDTAGGANLWVQLAYDEPATLVGKPAYEWSDYSFSMTGTNITGSATCLTFGDFNEFTIIDRIGMSVEPVPIMFATNANLPNGNRGLFARWRNTSDVRTAAAFRHLQIKA